MSFPEEWPTTTNSTWSRDSRTLQWVQQQVVQGSQHQQPLHQIQQHTAQQQSTMANNSSILTTTTGVGGSASHNGMAAYCGQDCGDGFCYNVWNSMVHV